MSSTGAHTVDRSKRRKKRCEAWSSPAFVPEPDCAHSPTHPAAQDGRQRRIFLVRDSGRESRGLNSIGEKISFSAHALQHHLVATSTLLGYPSRVQCVTPVTLSRVYEEGGHFSADKDDCGAQYRRQRLFEGGEALWPAAGANADESTSCADGTLVPAGNSGFVPN